MNTFPVLVHTARRPRPPPSVHAARRWLSVRVTAAAAWYLVSGLSPSPCLGPATYVRPPYQRRTNKNSLRLESHAVGVLAFVSPHPRTAVSHPHTKHWRTPKSVWVSLSEAPPSRFQITFGLFPLSCPLSESNPAPPHSGFAPHRK